MDDPPPSRDPDPSPREPNPWPTVLLLGVLIFTPVGVGMVMAGLQEEQFNPTTEEWETDWAHSPDLTQVLTGSALVFTAILWLSLWIAVRAILWMPPGERREPDGKS